MPLPTTARTAIARACAQVSPRRAAGEFLAHCIVTNPDDYPADMLAAARVVLGEGV
jgi:hypothetical protein